MANKRYRILFWTFILQLACNVFFLYHVDIGNLLQFKKLPACRYHPYATENGTRYKTKAAWNGNFKPVKKQLGSKQSGFSKSNKPESSLLQETRIPKIVHMLLWNNSLSFRNYLSIQSVLKILNPYQIILYTLRNYKPKEYDYNDWFLKATSRISSLQVVKLDFLEKNKYTSQSELDGAFSVLKDFGGIYININTLILADVLTVSNRLLEIGLTTDCKSIGYIFMARNAKIQKHFTLEKAAESRDATSCSCVTSETFTDSDVCWTLKNELFPFNIMYDESYFGNFSRTLFYGKPDIPKPVAGMPHIPKLVHYVWFGEKDIDYTMFLSFLSTQRFVKPLETYIYVDHNISRPYFDKMLAYGNVQIIYYGNLVTVFQKPIVKTLHKSDIVRADVLLRYGGVYLDWDVYWLKPADDLFTRGYETIASLDFFKDMFPRQGFPDTVNMGVLLAKPGSKFLSLWHDSFKQYTGKHHTYHAVELVYKLYEEHPDLLVIDRRLQVMCHELRCHPLWIKNYKNDKLHTTFDFTKDAYTVHFTDPIPPDFLSEENIRTAKGFFGNMGRHILGIQ